MQAKASAFDSRRRGVTIAKSRYRPAVFIEPEGLPANRRSDAATLHGDQIAIS
jgi:hypothetical protein